MAARDSQHSTRFTRPPRGCLSTVELATRLDEEVHRAARQGTALSCLLVSLDDFAHLSRTHGEDLPGHALSYLGSTLSRQLRRFDRVGRAAEGELLVVLPGADERRAEIVARRALGRLHSVKIEVEGKREPLRVSVGIAVWRVGSTAERLLAQTRIAAQRQSPADPQSAEPCGGPSTGVEGMPVLRPS